MFKVLIFQTDIVTARIIVEQLSCDYNIQICTKFSTLKKSILDFKPNLLITHCHSEQGDFNVVKSLTYQLKSELKEDIHIIVTHSPFVNEYYKKYNFTGYLADSFIARTKKELLDSEIKKAFNNVYKQ